MDSVGERIKEARINKRLTQAELAKLIGLKSSQEISNWERSKKGPRKNLALLAEKLEVSVDWILKGEIPKNSKHIKLDLSETIAVGHTRINTKSVSITENLKDELLEAQRLIIQLQEENKQLRERLK